MPNSAMRQPRRQSTPPRYLCSDPEQLERRLTDPLETRRFPVPDPITSSSTATLTCHFDDDPSLSCISEPPEPPDACLPPDAPAESATSSGSSALVQKFPRNEQPAFIAASPSPSSARGSGSAPPGVLSVRPDQLDLHTGIPRIQAQTTLGSVRLSAGVDLLNAGAHLGSLNDDGSRGENIGAGATVLGGELNIDYKGWTLIVGVAASLGGSISSGESRDLDGDGVEERCFAMSLGPFTLGECDEL